MGWLILSPAKMAELSTLNNAHAVKKCMPMVTLLGVYVLKDDKLGDIYWQDYQSFLSQCSIFIGTPILDLAISL